jgi:hypothetical protein
MNVRAGFTVAAVFALSLVACSGNDDADALANEIRQAGSPFVSEVLVDHGSWHEAWGVIIVSTDATDEADARTLWCDVVLPAWDRGSVAQKLSGAPSDRLSVEVSGSPISVEEIECPKRP